jgi:AmpE protein
MSLFIQKRISIPGYQRSNRWYYALLTKLEKFTLKGNTQLLVGYGVAVVLPSLLILLITNWLSHFSLGFFVMVFDLLLLLYILGRADVNAHMDQYTKYWQENNYEAAYNCAHDFFKISNDEELLEPAELHERYLNALLYRWFERFFVVVFGYMTMGMAGALLCFLSILFVRRYHKHGIAKQLLHIIEWLPSRLLGFSFVLAGNYVAGIQVWLKTVWDLKISTRDYLSSIGLASLELQQCSERLNDLDSEELAKKTIEEVADVKSILQRCAVIWLVAFALMSLLGL